MSPSDQQPLVFDNPWSIELFKLMTVKHALKLQMAGIGIGPVPRTPIQVLQKDYGFKGRTVAKAIPFVDVLLAKHQSGLGCVPKPIENPDGSGDPAEG